MKLADWMKSKSLDDDALAKQLGDVTGHAVKKWRYGERRPRHGQIQRIAELTSGAVTANDFFASEVA